MRKQRYMIVEHPIEKDVANNFHGMKVHIHDHIGNYNWHRLDADHILLLGTYSVVSHKLLHSLTTVSVLPVVSSGKTVADSAKARHYMALKFRIPIKDHHTMSDLIEHAEIHFGPMLTPDF